MNNADSNFLVKKERVIILLLLLLALIIRIGIIIKIEEPIDKDALEYYSIAKNVIEKHIFSIDGVSPTSRRSPGYPMFLALFITLFGSNPTYIYIVQAFVNILTIYLIYLSLKILKTKSAVCIIITALFVIDTSFVYVNVLYAEIVTMLIITILLYISVNRTVSEKKYTQSILQGTCVGVLILLRPTFLYLPIFIIVCIIICHLFKLDIRAKESVIVSIVAILTILPWSIRNRIVFDQWIPLVNAGGSELWQANLEIENLTVWYSVTNIEKYEQQRTESAALQSQLRSEYRQLYNLNTDIELNQFLKQKAKEIILAHPFRYTLLCFNRFLIFWFSPPIGSATLNSVSSLIFVFFLSLKYWMTILGIFGLWRYARLDFSGAFVVVTIVAYATVLHSATHAIQRYFLPVIPLVYFGLGYFLNSLKIKTSDIYNKNRNI